MNTNKRSTLVALLLVAVLVITASAAQTYNPPVPRYNPVPTYNPIKVGPTHPLPTPTFDMRGHIPPPPPTLQRVVTPYPTVIRQSPTLMAVPMPTATKIPIRTTPVKTPTIVATPQITESSTVSPGATVPTAGFSPISVVFLAVAGFTVCLWARRGDYRK